MASLNLSINGASIKSSYNEVVNATISSSSPNFAQWALFSVQAPLMNAFQDSASKESILKVQTTGSGDITELVDEFSDGRVQYAFLKVKDPNSGLPKSVLIAWCGGGVPERTKGYFTSHTAAVAKVLHGYHVQITARSDGDLEPEAIMQKVADASGSKYSAGGAGGAAPAPKPPAIKSKPVFTPTSSSRAINPIVAARSKREENVDEDGWGADAPPVTRSEIQKVDSAYKPTKVDMASLTGQKSEPSRFTPSASASDRDVIGGSYQPVGKVDIAALRAQARNAGDDRPTTVKGAYEPVGKVDIAAIRAKAQKPADAPSAPPPAPEPEEESGSRSLADRASAFSQPAQAERITSMPKPKVANKFGGASSFTGTKAPTPGGMGFGTPTSSGAPPIGAASRTFADSAGKTPAQLWAEKKAKQGGGAAPVPAPAPEASPVASQKSGEWKSGYAGKSWAPVSAPGYGKAATGPAPEDEETQDEPAAEEPAGGISSIRDRFKGAAPMGSSAPPPPMPSRGMDDDDEPAPPPIPDSSRPAGGFALPGLPSRGQPADEEEEEEDPSAYQADTSPIEVAMPVRRGTEQEDAPAPPPVPPSQIDVPHEDDLPDESHAQDMARGAAGIVAQQSFGPDDGAAPVETQQGGKRAVVQYDYEITEDNEIALVEGEYVTNIDMVDDDWWMGTNAKGESGLFPSNYVELVGDDDDAGQAGAPPSPPPAVVEPEPEPEPAPAPPPPASAAAPGGGATATALYDYEAAEDNELSFPEDAKITQLEFPDEDWWFGHYGGKSGLFPANYVQRDQ